MIVGTGAPLFQDVALKSLFGLSSARRRGIPRLSNYGRIAGKFKGKTTGISLEKGYRSTTNRSMSVWPSPWGDLITSRQR